MTLRIHNQGFLKQVPTLTHGSGFSCGGLPARIFSQVGPWFPKNEGPELKAPHRWYSMVQSHPYTAAPSGT